MWTMRTGNETREIDRYAGGGSLLLALSPPAGKHLPPAAADDGRGDTHNKNSSSSRVRYRTYYILLGPEQAKKNSLSKVPN